MTRIAPGRMLASLGDEKRAAEIAAETMLKLWHAKPEPAQFQNLEDWTSGLSKLRVRFSGGTGPIGPELVDAAERIRAELLPSCSDAVLLHGDLHHFNILQDAGGEWLAIDPKGVMAEPAYEPAVFLLNPDPAACLDREIQKTRIDIFAEALHLDRERILAWAFFHSVLSTWWTIENGGKVRESHNAKARLLRSLLR
jgi:streptomycin 6-kinase